MGLDDIKTTLSLQNNKLQTLSVGIQNKQNFTDAEKKQLAETARGFESIFINLIFKGMKSAMLDSLKDSNEQDSFGVDTLSGYTDMAFADEISNTKSGIGIAQMIYQQIVGGKLNPLTLARKASTTKEPKNTSATKNASIKFDFANNNDNTSSKGNLIQRVEERIRPYSDTIATASKQYDIPIPIIKAVITAESAGNKSATSPVGAKGLMQLMDGTAKGLGVQNSYDPHQNIMGGTKYLRQMLNTFDGDLEKSIAAYNAGPGNVKKYNGIPPFKETQAYVKKVKSHIQNITKNQ